MARRTLVSLWLGFALAALFFYPLAAALASNLYYLQWQTADMAEAVAAWLVLALVFAGILFVVWPRPTRSAAAILVLVAALPLASLAAGVARELPYDDVMRAAWEHRLLRLAVPAILAAAFALAFLLRPEAFGRWIRRSLVLVSPVSLVVAGAFVTAAPQGSTLVAFERAEPAAGPGSGCSPVLALLFDELSFSYVYTGGAIAPEFPSLRRFGASATHYLTVSAPGRETLSAVPSLLAARRVEGMRVENDRLMEVADGTLRPFDAATRDGLFAAARDRGFRSEMGGYYLAYCELLAGLVDACRSRSFYNVNVRGDRFSPLDPVLTTLVLWPRQFPFGLLKNRAFAIHQRDLVEELSAFARRPFGGGRPVFRLVHFSVPHLPFVFDAGGYDPPLNPLQTSPDAPYVRQLRYVDRMIGELLEDFRRQGLYDDTTVVVLADHGYRFGGRERDPLHIPFLVKTAGQQARAEIVAPRAGEALLKDVIAEACASGQAIASAQ